MMDEHAYAGDDHCPGCYDFMNDTHADRRDTQRLVRKVLDNRRSVFLVERLSREPQRRRTIRRRKGV